MASKLLVINSCFKFSLFDLLLSMDIHEYVCFNYYRLYRRGFLDKILEDRVSVSPRLQAIKQP